MPTVFNFYTWDYSPNGVANEAGLFAPEAGLANGPYLIGMLNGIRSLVKYGLSSCYYGFGTTQYKDCSPVSDVKDPTKNQQGDLTWEPVSNVTDASGVLEVCVPKSKFNTRLRIRVLATTDDPHT